MRSLIPTTAAIILLTTFTTATEPNEPLSTIHEGALSLISAFGKLRDPDGKINDLDGKAADRRTTLDHRAIDLDRRLAFEVFRLLVKVRTDATQTGSKCVEQVAKETSDLITWHRFQDKFTHVSRGPTVALGDTKFHVQYVCAEGADGSFVVVLQNVLAGNMPSVYVIRFDPDGAELKLLPPRCRHAGCEWSSFETSPTVIGIRRLEGSPPEVLVLFGPAGSGSFSAIYAYRLDGLGKYQPSPIAEFSGNTNYHLDAAKNEFIYYQHIEDKTVRSVVRLK